MLGPNAAFTHFPAAGKARGRGDSAYESGWSRQGLSSADAKSGKTCERITPELLFRGAVQSQTGIKDDVRLI